MSARAIAAEDRALAVDPNFIPALVYKNIFLRLQANLTADPSQRERLIVEADALRQTVIVLQESGRGNGARAAAPDGAMPPPPPPPPPPPGSIDFSAMPPQFARLVKEYDPLPIGTTPPMKVHDVKPVYPPIASAARVQGVVALEVLIDASGSVVDAHVIRSIPLLDEAARSAVMQWKYRPLPLNGQTHAVLAVVTVNFTVQP
jgi:protein TonB